MPPHRHHLLALLLFTAPIALAPMVASAQGTAEENMALKNYEKAKQAYGAGDFELAAELLQKAYAEDPDLIYQYNRIRALQAMGSFDEALKTIDLFRGPMSRDKAQRFTDLDELEAQIKAERIEFEKTRANDPKEPDVKEPDVKDPDIKAPITPLVDEDEAESRASRRKTGFVLFGAGALAAAGTSPFWSGLLLKRDACFGADATNEEDAPCFNSSERDRFKSKKTNHRIIGGVGLGVGAALGITGLIMVLKNGKPAEEPEASSVTFMPTISQDRAGASMMIRF